MSIQEIRKNVENAIEISELIGIDKPIAYCEKKIQKLECLINEQKEQINHIKDLGIALYQAGETKEKSWGLYGGIANGLAGSAAGVATALHVQRENEQAKINNAQLSQATASLVSNVTSGMYAPIQKYENRIKNLRNEIQFHRQRIVENLPEIELLKKLNLCIVNWQLTTSNFMKMTVKISAAKISTDRMKNATIDGSFKALIVDNNDQIINEIFFNLPYDGAAKESELTGYSINPIEENNICKIIFIPVYLWGIQTNLDVKKSSTAIRAKFIKEEVANFWEKDITNRQNSKLPEHYNAKIVEIESEYALTIKECISGIVGALGIIVGIICLSTFIKYGMSFSDFAITLLMFTLGAILIYISKIEITDKRYFKASKMAKVKEDNEKKMNLLNKQLEEIQLILK